MQTPQISAIVPMRHKSERVESKNFRLAAGRPLYHYIIETLLKCKTISRVVIDTDSPIIMGDAAKAFPDVLVLQRPEHLRDGKTPMNEVIRNTLDNVDGDFFLQTHSTNPLLREETIDEAIARFVRLYPEHDSLFGVTRLQERLWDGLARAVNHNPSILMRTQDLPPIYQENSNLYIFERETFKRRRNRIGERPLLYEIDRLEAWDIDEMSDFRIAEALLRERHGVE